MRQGFKQHTVSESGEVRRTMNLEHDNAHNVIICLKLKPATRLPMPRPRNFLPFSRSRGREARLARARGRQGLRAR